MFCFYTLCPLLYLSQWLILLLAAAAAAAATAAMTVLTTLIEIEQIY
jgi:hypothetical protein